MFEFVVNWVSYDLEERKNVFPQLYKLVCQQFVPIQYVAEIIRLNSLVKKIHECRDSVEEAFAFHVSPNVYAAQ